MFQINRRSFLKAMMATGAVTPLSFCLSAPNTPRKPNLRFGVISDVHISLMTPDGSYNYWNANHFEHALRWFDAQKVDAVMIAGDMAQDGLVGQLTTIANTWFKVFPNDKGSDGRTVERFFIHGNHDIDGYIFPARGDRSKYPELFEKSIKKNPQAAWQKCFHEDFKPIITKQIKGYTFIGRHWGIDDKTLKETFDKILPTIDPAKPFFFTQHDIPKNTSYGPLAWGKDNGFITNFFSNYHNAIVFSGHSHYPISDESCIWQEGFTSIGTGSLRYMCDRDGRENSESSLSTNVQMQRTDRDTQVGLLVSVYDDSVVIARRDMTRNISVGPDWILPVPMGGKPIYSHAIRREQFAKVPPAFSQNALEAVTVVEAVGKNRKGDTTNQVTVTFPTAIASGIPAYDYEVVVSATLNDVRRICEQRRVYASQFYLPLSHHPKTANCIFAADGLPHHVKLDFEITPLDCFGNRGKTIILKNITLKGVETPKETPAK